MIKLTLKKNICCLAVLCTALCVVPGIQSVRAQDSSYEDSPSYSSAITRFLFGQEELDKLTKALSGGYKKIPDAPEAEPEEESEIPRTLSLAGLIYSAPDDWSFWLNAQKVTPKTVPDTLKNLYVTKNYIDFEWYDEQAQNPVQLRLRPHQSFHLDTKVFFTGPAPRQISQ